MLIDTEIICELCGSLADEEDGFRFVDGGYRCDNCFEKNSIYEEVMAVISAEKIA